MIQIFMFDGNFQKKPETAAFCTHFHKLSDIFSVTVWAPKKQEKTKQNNTTGKPKKRKKKKGFEQCVTLNKSEIVLRALEQAWNKNLLTPQLRSSNS